MLNYAAIQDDIKHSIRQSDGKWLRLGEHVDWNDVTYLFQDDVGGLEIVVKDSEQNPAWVPVNGRVIVQLGKMFQAWTNNAFKAPVHRIVANEAQAQQTRVSLAWFVHPDRHTVLDP